MAVSIAKMNINVKIVISIIILIKQQIGVNYVQMNAQPALINKNAPA